MKCDSGYCTNEKAWAFRDVGFWHGKSKKLCDECYGHKYGDFTCRKCEQNCYEEDMEDNAETYLCGHCRREAEQLAAEKSIETDVDAWQEAKNSGGNYA